VGETVVELFERRGLFEEPEPASDGDAARPRPSATAPTADATP
jgi:hypothetical protein